MDIWEQDQQIPTKMSYPFWFLLHILSGIPMVTFHEAHHYSCFINALKFEDLSKFVQKDTYNLH